MFRHYSLDSMRAATPVIFGWAVYELHLDDKCRLVGDRYGMVQDASDAQAWIDGMGANEISSLITESPSEFVESFGTMVLT